MHRALLRVPILPLRSLSIVAVIDVIGLGLESSGLVRGFYASPFVAMIAICSVRWGCIEALAVALMSALSFNFFFVQPRTEFSIPTPEEWTAYASMLAAVACGSMGGTLESLKRHTESTQLPFTDRTETDKSLHGTGLRFWSPPEPTGDYAADTSLGQQYARIWLHKRGHGSTPLLGWLLRDMVFAGKWGAIETGFASAIERALPADYDADQTQLGAVVVETEGGIRSRTVGH